MKNNLEKKYYEQIKQRANRKSKEKDREIARELFEDFDCPGGGIKQCDVTLYSKDRKKSITTRMTLDLDESLTSQLNHYLTGEFTSFDYEEIQ